MLCLELNNNGTIPYIKCGTTCYIFDEDNNVIREAKIISFKVGSWSISGYGQYYIKYKCSVAGFEDFVYANYYKGHYVAGDYVLYTSSECNEVLHYTDTFNIKDMVEKTYGSDVANDAIIYSYGNNEEESTIRFNPKLYFCTDWSDLTNTYAEILECRAETKRVHFEISGDNSGVHFNIAGFNDGDKMVEDSRYCWTYFLRKQDLIDYYEKKKTMSEKNL